MIPTDVAICLIAVVAAVGGFFALGGKEVIKEWIKEFKKGGNSW